MPETLSPEDRKSISKAVEEAAYMVIVAKNEAAAKLEKAGIDMTNARGWFGSPCGAILPPPPQQHRCGCNNYKGDGGPCRTRCVDPTGPDTGSGNPTYICGHLPSQHRET